MLEKKEYENGVLEDEYDALVALEEYEGEYLCDGIMEIADGYVPLDNNEIWKHAYDVKEDIEEAISEGLTDGVTDLTKIFAIGYYEHYQRFMYDNIEDVAYNVLVKYYNELTEVFTKYEDEIIEIIEELAKDFDSNDSWDDLRKEFEDKLHN